MIEERLFSDRDQLFAALANDCQRLLQTAVDSAGQASFLVSGGSTPQPLYQRLSRTELPWAAINVALVDERWVDSAQPGSNEAFIKQYLLQGPASAARYVAMKNQHASAIDGLADCERAYQSLPRPFSLTILGMGPDAHTASLFPQAQGLDAAMAIDNKQLCAAIKAAPSEVTGALTERMSLSLYGLLQSQQLHLLITGEDKLKVYRAALENSDIASSPISAVLSQTQVPVYVYWAP